MTLNSTAKLNFYYHEGLHSNIVSMLQQELYNAIFFLPPSLRRSLRKPIIALVPGLSVWGRWHSAPKRLLELRLELVLEHPWYAVREVLLHELAHLVIDECYPHISESAHGPTFRKICLRLGSNPSASSHYPTMDQRLLAAEGSASKQDQVLQKLRKLLALSESGNIHEAEVALLKARQLSAKYALELTQDTQETQFHMIFLGEAKARLEMPDYIMANILQDHFKVLCIWDQVPDFSGERWLKVLKLHGTLGNLKIAGYVYDCLQRQIEASWSELCRKQNIKKPGVRMKRDFSIGVLQGFAKLLGEDKQPESECCALVLQQERRLAEYYRQHNPGIRKISSGGIKIDQGLYAKGEKTGRGIVIADGLEKPSSPGLKALNP